MLLVSAPGFAQTFQSFDPGREAGTPTYLNAEVVRVSSDGTATIRSESGDVVLTADLRAVAALPGVRAGDKLLLAYETVYDDSGRERRIVTYARPASPGSGEPGPSVVMAAAGASGGSAVRVISTNRAQRTITVTDASGEPLTLPLSSRASANLGRIQPGDVIGLDFVTGGVVNPNALPVVSGFQALPAGTGVGSFVVPPLSGQFVGFDAGTNRLTVQTADGRQQTFTVSGTAGSGLAGLRPGDNLSLGFQVTQQANRARVRAGGSTTVTTAPGTVNLGAASGSTLLSVGNVSTFSGTGVRPTALARTSATRGTFSDFGANTMGVTGAANVGAVTTNAQAARLATAQSIGGANNTFTNQNLAGFGNTAGAGAGQGVSVNNATANRTGIAAGGFSPIGGTSVGSGGVPGTGIPGSGVATAGAGGTGTVSNMGAGLPFLGTGFATPSVGPGSPFSNTVPSVPTPGPVMTAVLPPATAKAPLSQEDVGLLRAYGERDLDAAAVVLAMVANDIDAGWFRFKMACLGGFTAETSPGREWFLLLDDRVRTPTDDACRAMYSQLQGQAAGWETQLGIALDAARRADVLPGRIRETLDRHRIDR
jgi:hypothetical protein